MGTALITGASSGLGEEFAWQLAARKHNLVLVARRENKLRALAHQIHQAAHVEVEVICADLTKETDLKRVVERLRDPQKPVGLLVNNAGGALGQRFTQGDLGREIWALDLMVKAPLVLAHAAAKAMIARGHGAILNVSSIASQTAYGTYAAHKAWLRSFNAGLAADLAGTEVSATALMPGWVRTNFHEAAGIDPTVWPAFAWVSPQKVVADALRAVALKKTEVVPSLRYQAVDLVLKHTPRALVRATTGKVVSRGHKLI